MGTMIRLEMMKWRRSKILLSAILAVFVAPFITMLSMWIKMNATGAPIHWVDILALCMQINHLFIFPLTFGALTAFVFVQEYQTKVIVNLFTLPVSRTAIILSKTVTLFLTLMVLNLISYVLNILIGVFFLHSGAGEAFVQYFPLALKTGLMQVLLIPIFICVGVWTRHYIPPIVAAGICIMIDFVSLAIPNVGLLLFPALPYYVILHSIGWYNGVIPFTWGLLIPACLLFMSASIWIAEKRDIH
jgi:bacitracin transport system permease protein